MSVIVSPMISTGDLTTAPQIITSDLFPHIYALDTPDAIIDERFDLYPNVYTDYGLPSILTPSIDPAYITGPQKYEYKYKNENGVEVVIRGTYNDVMSSVDVLNTYPPLKKECDTPKKKYFPIYGPGSNPTPAPTNVPAIGTKKDGQYIHLDMGGKIYSGSGSLILVVQNGDPLDAAKIILFMDPKTKQYQETGGRIDLPAANTKIDADTLFKNAAKETSEESAMLFSLSNQSQNVADVSSTLDNTVYRVYVYLIKLNNINNLSAVYDKNKRIIRGYPAYFDESYTETSDLKLFDLKTFVAKLQSRTFGGTSNAPEYFQDTNGTQRLVRLRTMNVIANINSNNLFNDIIRNNKVSSVTETITSSDITTVVISA
jgi:hypothetical protein